jgi:cytochrome c553
VVGLLLVVVSYGALALTGNPISGQQKSAACVACHGIDGNTTTATWPKIAGMSEGYLLKQLLEYKKGEKGSRFDPTMYSIVATLSEQDLADLAAFYATQVATIGQVPANYVQQGQAVYRGGNLASGVPACAACHSPSGDGNYLALFPRLGGQNGAYVRDQLLKFKTKQRSNDPNSMMRDIAARMSDEEMEAVAQYVQGLH